MMSRRFAGAGLMRRAARSPIVVPSSGTTPTTVFGAKASEWWRADLGVGIVSDEVDTWAGQVAGTTLSAAASTNRCAFTAQNANFNDQPTVNGSRSGGNRLRATGINPALPFGDPRAILMVGRSSAAYGGSTEYVLYLRHAGPSDTEIVAITGASTLFFRTILTPGSTTQQPTATITDPALWRREFRSNVANGAKGVHNASVSQDNPGAVTIASSNVTEVWLFDHPSTGFGSNIELAELVLLDDIPTTEELAAYEEYTLSRYGVPP